MSKSGAAPVLCRNSREQIPHIQGQRSPSKTGGTGAAVRREPTSKGKGEAPADGRRAKEKPQQMVGGAKLHLESNPIPARDAQRAQTNRVCTRTRGPHGD